MLFGAPCQHPGKVAEEVAVGIPRQAGDGFLGEGLHHGLAGLYPFQGNKSGFLVLRIGTDGLAKLGLVSQNIQEGQNERA